MVGSTTVGSIASRIDRLPLCRTQYLLAIVTQLFWGIIIANDGLCSRLYPLVWEPAHVMSALQFDGVLFANIGLGILVGEYGGSYLADRFGRKKILIVAAFVDGIFLWPMALTNSFGWLMVWNFLYGIGLGMVLAVNAVYMHEIAPPKTRQRLAMRTQAIAIVIYMLLPGVLGYFWIPSHYQWAIYAMAACSIVILIPLGMLLPESPRWLEAKGRHGEAEAIVAKWESAIERRLGALPAPEPEPPKVVQTEKVPVKEIFQPPYRQRTIILWVCWFFGYAGMVYGYLSFVPTYLTDLGWSPQQLFLFTTILAAPVAAIAFLVIAGLGERFERRNVVAITGLIAAVAFLLLLVVHSVAGVAILVLIASPVGQSPWLFNMYNYTSAAYPTRLRSVGTGWTDGVGHLGSLTAPFVAGPLLVATAASDSYGWILFIALPGALLPALLIRMRGVRQKAMSLEEIAP